MLVAVLLGAEIVRDEVAECGGRSVGLRVTMDVAVAVVVGNVAVPLGVNDMVGVGVTKRQLVRFMGALTEAV